MTIRICFFQQMNHPVLCQLNVWDPCDVINEVYGKEPVPKFQASHTNRMDQSMNKADIIVFYRTGAHAHPVMAKMRQQGKLCVYSLDDWLGWPGLKACQLYDDISPAFRFCEMMFASTQPILDKYDARRKFTITNSMRRRYLDVMAGYEADYSGDEFHVGITKAHVIPPFPETVIRIARQIEKFGLSKRIVFHYFYPSEMFPKSLSQKIKFVRHDPVHGTPDVFWSVLPGLKLHAIFNPIEEGEFSDCKFPLKFFEAAGLGVPLIASRSYPFLKIMQGGEYGILGSTDQEYAHAFKRLIDHPEQCRQMGLAARKKVYDHHLLEKNIHEYVEPMLDELAAKREREKKITPDGPIKNQILDEKEADLQRHIDLGDEGQTICPPLMFLRSHEQPIQVDGKIRTLWFKGHTYGGRFSKNARVDIVRDGKVRHTAYISAKSMMDSTWWSCFSSSPIEVQKDDILRITNEDRRPLSFYHAVDQTIPGQIAVRYNP